MKKSWPALPVLESRNLFVLAKANPANYLLPHMACHDVRHICLLDGVVFTFMEIVFTCLLIKTGRF